MKVLEVPSGQNIYDVTYRDIVSEVEDGERFIGKTEEEVIAKFEASYPNRKILRVRYIWGDDKPKQEES